MNYLINGLLTDICDQLEVLEDQFEKPGCDKEELRDQLYDTTYLLNKVEQMQSAYAAIIAKRLKELRRNL